MNTYLVGKFMYDVYDCIVPDIFKDMLVYNNMIHHHDTKKFWPFTSANSILKFIPKQHDISRCHYLEWNSYCCYKSSFLWYIIQNHVEKRNLTGGYNSYLLNKPLLLQSICSSTIPHLQSLSPDVHCSLPHSDYQEIAVACEINENYHTFIMWHHPYALSRQLGVVISVACSLSMSTLLEKDSTSNWIVCLYSTRSLAPPLQRLCLHKHIRTLVWGNFLCFRRKPPFEINLKHGNNDKISEVVIPV